MDPLFTVAHAHVCDQPVTNAVEGYSPRGGRAHGSLDLVVYVCPQHVEVARRLVFMDHHLTPYTAVMAGEAGVDFKATCGKVTHWNDTPEEQACGCGGDEDCDTCGGIFVLNVPGQSVSDGVSDEHQEHADGPGQTSDLMQIRLHERK